MLYSSRTKYNWVKKTIATRDATRVPLFFFFFFLKTHYVHGDPIRGSKVRRRSRTGSGSGLLIVPPHRKLCTSRKNQKPKNKTPQKSSRKILSTKRFRSELPGSRRNALPHPPVRHPFPPAPRRRRSGPITGRPGLPNRLSPCSQCGFAFVQHCASGTPTRRVRQFGCPRRSGRHEFPPPPPTSTTCNLRRT